jgi:F-type H+-transporting ATPase subunit delta
MAAERTLAKRYARALLEVALERKRVDEVEAELYAVADLYEQARDFRTVVLHPALPMARKRELLGKTLGGKVQDFVLRFLRLLLEKGRLRYIREIAAQYDDLSDELQGLVKARVRAFLPLKPEQRRALEEKLMRFAGRRRVILHEAVDRSLLGGIVVRIGDDVLDGSVAGRLRKMREHLLRREHEATRGRG